MADFIQIPKPKIPVVQINPIMGNTGKYDPNRYKNPYLPDDERFARDRNREPGYLVTKALDLLSRGQYASAAFADVVLSQGIGELGKGIVAGINEGLFPKARLGYEDIIKRQNPEFAKENPWITFGIGLAGDILLDPTTYIGIGLIGKGKKVGGLALNKVGKELFDEVLEFEAKRIAKEFGEESGEKLVRETGASFFRANQKLIPNRLADGIVSNIINDSAFAERKLTELGLTKYIGQELTEKKGFRVYFGLDSFGFKSKEIPIYKVTQPIYENLGFKQVADKINVAKDLIYEGIKKTDLGKEFLTRSENSLKSLKGLFKVDNEVSERLKYYEDNFSNIGGDVLRDIIGIKEFKKADLKKVGDALLQSENIQNAVKSSRGFLDIVEQNGIRNKVFKDLNLNKEEKILTNLLIQRNNDIKFVEKGVELLTDEILSGSLEINKVIKNADELIQYKQLALEGRLSEFVAENRELQSKIFNLDNIKTSIGKEVINVNGKKQIFGKLSKETTLDTIKTTLGLTKNKSFNVVDTLVKTDNIIEGFGTFDDISKIKGNLLSKGFKDIPLTLSDDAGKIVDDGGNILRQSILKADDGSIIRIVSEKTKNVIDKSRNINGKNIPLGKENALKFTIIKSVSAPNEAFLTKYIGDTKIKDRTLDDLIKTQKVFDDVGIDTFGNVIKSIYNGSEFDSIYKTLKEKGNEIDINALTLYTNRAMQAQKQLGVDMFKTAIKSIYKIDNFDDAPKEILDRFKYVGEGLYGSGLGDASKKALEVLDFATSIFKKGATIFNPAFGLKQIPQNTLQASLKIGVDAFKVFDPRALLEGAALIATDGLGKGKSLPSYISNIFYKSAENKPFAIQAIQLLNQRNNADYIKNLVISTPTGIKYNGEEILDSAYKTGVLQGVLDDINIFERDITKEITFALGSDKQGVLPFAKNVLNYFKYPEQIDKFFRLSYYINGLRNGLSPDESAKIVKESLFEYTKSLTEFERRFVKRIIPFFSFQRNSIPLIIKSFLTEPGKTSVVSKISPTGAYNNFYSAYNKLQGGQQLGDRERYISPNYIFEQPNIFAGYDEKGKLTYNTFGNYTPFDAINLVGYDEEGYADFNKTMKKIILASINPYIKMSVEVPANRYFFNDRVLTESEKIGGLGRYIEMLPKEAQELLSFESVMDPISGEQKYFINPYIAYASMSFPFSTVLNNIVRATDDNSNYKERAMSLFLGIQTQKFDKESLEYTKAVKNQYRIKQIQSDYRKALKQGRMNKAEEEIDKLQRFVEILSVESSFEKK